MKKKSIILIIVSVVLSVFMIWMIWGNLALTVNQYTVESAKFPETLSGFRIAQISDLHNDELEEGNVSIISALEKADPDVIVITGDIIDRSRTDIDVAIDLAKKISKIALTCYVSGNHESALSDEEYADFCKQLTAAGVVVLNNDSIELDRNGAKVKIVGISDESFGNIPSDSELKELVDDTDTYTILLAHRPNDFERYTEFGCDLVLSGHLHGGQFRLPFLGGLYAPSYGLFPEYNGGKYEIGESVMIVSRGVGNSSFPIRFNNPREIVIIEIINNSQK